MKDTLSVFDPQRWRDKDLLRRALTHSSARGRVRGAGADASNTDNETLEFLGDRVLGLVLAQMLYDRVGHRGEADMARRIADLGSGVTCARVGEAMGLWDEMSIARSARKGPGRSRILANGVEALLGALFLDSGWESARAWTLEWWTPLLEDQIDINILDAKSRLQEIAQAQGGLPEYDTWRLGSVSSQPHFRSRVRIPSEEATHCGEGSSKKEAERVAAEAMLAVLDAAQEAQDAPQDALQGALQDASAAWLAEDWMDDDWADECVEDGAQAFLRMPSS